MKRPAPAVVVVALLALLPLARAGERRHTVEPGESASAIAKRYYGDYALTDLLLLYNERTGTTIRPGEKLRIPYCEVHRVAAGDSWSALAQRYLGRPSVYPVVAELNGRVPERPLQVGEEIVFPVILKTKLRRGDTLASLARRFFDTDRTRLLQELNRLEDPRRLSVGQSIEIPLMDLRLNETAPPPAPKPDPEPVASAAKQEPVREPEPVEEPEEEEEPTPPPPPTPPPARFTKELRAATDAFEAGEFERAQGLLGTFREGVQERGSPAEQAEYWRLQSFVHVAFDRWEQACAALQSIPAEFSAEPLDPVLVSPKIRRALSRCEAS